MTPITTEMLEAAGYRIFPSITHGRPRLFAYDKDSKLVASSINNGETWFLRQSTERKIDAVEQ